MLDTRKPTLAYRERGDSGACAVGMFEEAISRNWRSTFAADAGR